MLSMSASTLHTLLTPYVSELVGAAQRAGREMLGVPDPVPVAFEARVGDDPHHYLRAGDGPHAVRMELRRDGAGWLRLPGLSVRLQSIEGQSPATHHATAGIVRDLGRRLHALSQRSPQSIEAFFEAAERAARFAEVRDTFLRDLCGERAIVRLGFRCNQKCDFCWQERDWPEPEPEYYYRWVEELAGAGVQTISFSGGEPTLHRELLPLVRHARSFGLSVTLETNAVRLAKPGFAEELRSSGVGALFVSYHSHVPEVSDAMTRAPGTHRRTEEGIAEAIGAGLAVHLNCVVQQRNHAHLVELAEHVVARFVVPGGPDAIAEFTFSDPTEGAQPAESVPYDLVAPVLIAATRTLSAAGVPVRAVGTCGFPPCLFGAAPELIRPIGSMGDLEQQRARQHVPACDTCAMRDGCSGVRSNYLERYGARGINPLARAAPTG